MSAPDGVRATPPQRAGAAAFGGPARVDPWGAREALIREALVALGAGAPERFLGCLTSDATLEDPLADGVRSGVELVAWLRLRHEAFPRAAYEPLRILLNDDAGAVEWHARLRDPAGREHALAGVAMLDFDADRISRIGLFYDSRGLARSGRSLPARGGRDPSPSGSSRPPGPARSSA